MYKGKSVSIAIATYKERRSIKKVIDDFWETGLVDEIVVVNNNAEKGTNEEIKKTNAYKKGKLKLLDETNQGYGYAFQKAIISSTSDLIIVSEPDSSFSPKEIERFLIYSEDFEAVIGTRTSQIGSLSGEGMGIIRKFANVIEAKTIEILFNSVALTDVGCTFKLFTKSTIKKISPFWKHKKTALFNTELILLLVREKIKFVEIPITYNKRIGKSQIVGKWYQVIKWAIVIQLYIFVFWIKSKLTSQK